MTSKAVFCFDFDDFLRVENAILSSNIESDDFLSFSSNFYENQNTDQIPEFLSESDLTVVLIGKHTFENPFCLQMIYESFCRGNAFLAVYLDNARDVKKSGQEITGKNPLDLFYFEHKEGKTTLNQGAVVLPGMLKRRFSSKEIKAKTDFIKTYDFISDHGSKNLKKWMEEERLRKSEFWAECFKIKSIGDGEWENALKLTHKGGVAGFFLYYDWAESLKKENEESV
ncbi:MAG: hypothetical protein RBQ94_04575 [Methanimicrococcus sp.]|nr:hypothetical protein [Methanimicrococcus sp.]